MEDDKKVEEAKEVVQQSNAEDMVKKAMDAAERLEKANLQLEAHLKKLESDKVKRVLSGRADVGPVEAKEETPAEYRERVMRGEL